MGTILVMYTFGMEISGYDFVWLGYNCRSIYSFYLQILCYLTSRASGAGSGSQL